MTEGQRWGYSKFNVSIFMFCLSSNHSNNLGGLVTFQHWMSGIVSSLCNFWKIIFLVTYLTLKSPFWLWKFWSSGHDGWLAGATLTVLLCLPVLFSLSSCFEGIMEEYVQLFLQLGYMYLVLFSLSFCLHVRWTTTLSYSCSLVMSTCTIQWWMTTWTCSSSLVIFTSSLQFFPLSSGNDWWLPWAGPAVWLHLSV